jgi:hypothetical protein
MGHPDRRWLFFRAVDHGLARGHRALNISDE